MNPDETYAGEQDAEAGSGAKGQQRHNSGLSSLMKQIWLSPGIEKRGIQPVPLDERTDQRTYTIFTLWFAMSTNLLPIVTGMAGTLSFGLDLRAAALVILFFSLFCTTPVAYLALIGPKTGMRQMIQAKFSFGMYCICIPVVLNLATLTGYCIIETVIAGQTLSAVADGSLTPNVGIVIVALLGMCIGFCGIKVLHQYERFAWIPAVIIIVIATGCGGTHLSEQQVILEPGAAAILSYAALVAGFLLPWAALASDYVTYIDPKTPRLKVFGYTYSGLFLPTVLLMILGAAIGGSVPNVPSWLEGYESTSVGGVLAAMLEPAGGFGKFLVVILAFTILGNYAATVYSITLNFQLLIPWLVHVPRFVFSIVITAIVIPVAIQAATTFFVSLENFLGIIGFWSAAFVAVVTVEHALFRHSDYSKYDHEMWNDSKKLPTGLAALSASALSFALVIPSMGQVWWTGPIARHTGDIGFEMAFVVTVLLYIPFRCLEIRLLRRR